MTCATVRALFMRIMDWCRADHRHCAGRSLKHCFWCDTFGLQRQSDREGFIG